MASAILLRKFFVGLFVDCIVLVCSLNPGAVRSSFRRKSLATSVAMVTLNFSLFSVLLHIF